MLRTSSLAAILLLLMAPLTVADEDAPAKPAAPGEQPVAEVPAFGLEAFIPPADAFPDGWSGLTSGGVMPASAPSVRGMLELATQAGLDTGKLVARCRSLRRVHDGKRADLGVVAWVSLDAGSAAFAAARKKAAQERGWSVREVGGPTRLLIAWGSDAASREALLTWGVAEAVERLCDLGVETINSAGRQPDRGSGKAVYDRGVAILEAAGRTEPRAGVFHMWKGRMAESLARGAAGMGDRAGFERQQATAIEHYRKALAKGAPVPPPERMVATAAFVAGQGLLLMEDKSVLEEALHVLQRGVAAEEHATNPFHRFGNRYNLACTYARLGKLDPAFGHLETSLQGLKLAWLVDKEKSGTGASQLEYPRHYEHAAKVDGDLAPLREDPRWEALMKRCHPDAPPVKPAAEKAPEKAPEKKKDG
ncbi:MAG: hypothetical protein QNJ90_04910 [Planctomycetota bacterium]|nr:hypothetical protein [Planctomycetota bacterium]